MKIIDELVYEDFLMMENLEKRYYSEEYITDAEKSYQWYLHWRGTVKCLKVGNEVVGFMNLFPISSDLFDEISKGTFNDKVFTEDKIVIPFEKGKTYHLFFSCIVIDEKYRELDATGILLREYINFYSSLERKGIIFHKLIADNVTEEGIAFSKKIGLSQVRESDHHSKIFIGIFEDLKNCKKQTGIEM